ncbi:hypothetical protein [Oribacterium sp. WCC10]|uniref:hypothetical protein n=1 Tax=Oribacterium sp. WCC10 TaxID=1855343 RepID=UPI0008EEB743|nr:hypothetical protein [Oribacterium sp. WCC10]SFG13947.1 hypothetical protein SAMN05216356_10295 [Oribacterium sp. WCC10]
MNCSNCQKEADFRYRVLEVQTLHVRSLKGDNKVQALGKFQDYGICRSCAERKMRDLLEFSGEKRKHCFFSIVIIVMGCLILLNMGKEGLIGFTGLFFIIGGVMIEYGTVSEWIRIRKELMALPFEKRLERAAWQELLATAPKKSIDSDISYIPVNGETVNMKKGDFMVMYDLIPEIVEKAWSVINTDYLNQR